MTGERERDRYQTKFMFLTDKFKTPDSHLVYSCGMFYFLTTDVPPRPDIVKLVGTLLVVTQ